MQKRRNIALTALPTGIHPIHQPSPNVFPPSSIDRLVLSIPFPSPSWKSSRIFYSPRRTSLAARDLIRFRSRSRMNSLEFLNSFSCSVLRPILKILAEEIIDLRGYKMYFFLVRRKIWTRYAKESETRMDISEIEVFCVYRTRGTKANVRLHARRRGRKTWQEEGEQGQVRRKKGGKGKECRTQVGVGSVCKPRTAKATRLAFLHFFSASSPPPQPRAIRNVPYEIEITRW